uniref:Polypeptide N-acetylgalactosaminyltransferase 16 n=1 Tax=Sphaerodactylus townsendi TaxID=933632 RepID=A0ACB8G442_9SAUR
MRNLIYSGFPASTGALRMRRIRANAIAILTVAWILGTFYYLWQDNKPHSAASSRSPSSGGGRNGQRSTGKLELHKDERTIPLIVSAARSKWH